MIYNDQIHFFFYAPVTKASEVLLATFQTNLRATSDSRPTRLLAAAYQSRQTQQCPRPQTCRKQIRAARLRPGPGGVCRAPLTSRRPSRGTSAAPARHREETAHRHSPAPWWVNFSITHHSTSPLPLKSFIDLLILRILRSTLPASSAAVLTILASSRRVGEINRRVEV
jgi:hypothetical protein